MRSCMSLASGGASWAVNSYLWIRAMYSSNNASSPSAVRWPAPSGDTWWCRCSGRARGRWSWRWPRPARRGARGSPGAAGSTSPSGARHRRSRGAVWWPSLPVAAAPTRFIRRGRLVALAVGAFLLPWCVVLWATLSALAEARHWWLAWVGLDGAEAVMALTTTVLLTRRDVRASLTAAAGAALLLCDAWFDVCTSAPGLGQALAITEAVLAELPLAVAAAWLATRLLAANRGRRERDWPVRPLTGSAANHCSQRSPLAGFGGLGLAKHLLTSASSSPCSSRPN